MQERRSWWQVCASLNTLGDAQLAIDSFSDIETANDGGLYLSIYGLFQAMFLQQDATSHMAEALKIEPIENADLEIVRNARNDIVGHPTKKRGKPSFTTHTITRWSMSKAAIEVYSSSGDGDSIRPRTVLLTDLIQKQRAGIEARLVAIRDELLNRERNHKMSFANEPLQALFPQTLDYVISKVSEGIHTPGSAALGAANLEYVADIVSKFKCALEARNELPANEGLAYELSEVDHPIDRLRQYFASSLEYFTAADAFVFVFFLEHKLEHLREIARQIDAEYEEA